MKLYRGLVFLHLVAAVAWVGGLLYLGAAVVPAIRRLGLDDRSRQRMLAELGRRMRALGWTSLAVLVLTGLAMLAWRGAGVADVLYRGEPFFRVLRAKLALVGVLALLLIAHDAAGMAASRAAPGSPEAERRRRQASWLGRLVTLVSLAVLYLAVRLVRG